MPHPRILYEITAPDHTGGTEGSARRFAIAVARVLSESGTADVRVVGDGIRSGSNWMGGLRRLVGGRTVQNVIEEFRPEVIHTFGNGRPSGHAGTGRLFATLDDFRTPALDRTFASAQTAHAICPSEVARDDAVRVLGFTRERTSVVPPGVNLPPPGEHIRMARGNFFLFVGHRDGNGNFAALLQAVATTPTLSTTRIVAFGGGPLSSDERRLIADLNMKDRVTTTGGDDVALTASYASALALVYPSLYEGFGLPVLEAMAHGCPVAGSRTNSLPEVGGDSALYFDPTDPADIATALVHLSADAGLRERLATAGRQRAEKFTWKASAEKTLEVYHTILAGR